MDRPRSDPAVAVAVAAGLIGTGESLRWRDTGQLGLASLSTRRRPGPKFNRRNGYRMPTFASAMTLAASRGGERQYCLGAWTCAPSIAAACHGQRGFHSIARANATR